ncbi:MAG: Gfo/Idh/MocA family oxidoreductase [Candidatus Buchananbacteria bacterium]|jgi:predicted dehydrogenase
MKKKVGRNQVLQAGVVGGHQAFIASHHEAAIFMSGTRRVVYAALHQDPETALAAAKQWRYPLHGYASWQEMLAHQQGLPANDRIDFAVITTPNFCHFEQAMAFVKAGIPVVCEKPMTMTVAEADELTAAVVKTGVPFMLMHGYWGHWTARFARFIIQQGLIGRVIKATAEYDQDWLVTQLEKMGNQQAEWRTDPAKAGMSGCGGDIGTHALMQLEFVTGLPVSQISFARLASLIGQRRLDDDFTVCAQLADGTPFDIRASQVRVGHKNHLQFEVNGDKGSVIWDQEKPEELTVCRINKPDLVYWRGNVCAHDGFLKAVPRELLKTYWPSGHPEGLHDAWCRLYDFFEVDVRRYYRGLPSIHAGVNYAGVENGVRGMRFIEAAVECAQNGAPIAGRII